jgi:hypothetical protein
VNLANRTSGNHAHLDRADDFLRIPRGDSRAGFAVQPREDVVEILGAVPRYISAKPCAQFFRSLRCVGQAFEERAQVESSSRREDWNLAATAHVFENFESAPAILARRENFVGFDEIDEMV